MRDEDVRGSGRRNERGARAVVKRIASAIGSAFAYFTIFPVGALARGPAPDASALLALPLVGAVIGGLAGAIALASARIAPHGLVAAFALAGLVVASGAIHLDGFLDGCDAFFARVPPARRLEILKDPRHGTFALAGLFVLGTIWYAALAALPAGAYPATLAFAGALGRAGAIVGALGFPYSRGGRIDATGLGVIFVALACAAYLLDPPATLEVPAAALAGWLLARWIAGRLGGVLPGDGYGFIATVLEAGTTTVAALLWSAGRWPGSG